MSMETIYTNVVDFALSKKNEPLKNQIIQNTINTLFPLFGKSFKSAFRTKKLNEITVPFPHNTPTNKSYRCKKNSSICVGTDMAKLQRDLEAELASRNQYMTVEQYLSYAQYFPVFGLDVDVGWAKFFYGTGEKLLSKHGIRLGYLFNASDADTNNLFTMIFKKAMEQKDTIFILRNENYVKAKQFLTLLDEIDKENNFNVKCKDLLYTFPKGSMPTYGEVVASGKNIIMFLEKQKDDEFNIETGIYNEGYFLAQKCFCARTKWSKVSCLEKKNIKDCLIVNDFKYLPDHNIFILADLYNTAVGAEYMTLAKTHDFILAFFFSSLKRIKLELSKQNIWTEDNNACMFMVDMMTPEILLLTELLNFHSNIKKFKADPVFNFFGNLVYEKAKQVQDSLLIKYDDDWNTESYNIVIPYFNFLHKGQTISNISERVNKSKPNYTRSKRKNRKARKSRKNI